ncbi:MAG: hypothetical protein A3F68_04545 [Acidobacteria bacterium RIFCSPLOWO2_12_FULL_54_10]|nr:MAG: hypothetical protein A3F68_04545 [Acidobacteria bacterium RIFCSPLOWO2_12_FULL_54_10]
MLNYQGGQSVKSGFYWNFKRWEIVTIEKGAGLLPGSETDRYIKLPVLLFMCSAPFLGLLYVVFLPFIGFAMVFWLVARKIMQFLGKAITELRALVRATLRA